MIREILLKEIHEQILSFKSLMTFVVIMVLFTVSGFIFRMNYQERLAEYENVRSQTESALADGSASFNTLVQVRQQHLKPPSKLFFLQATRRSVIFPMQSFSTVSGWKYRGTSRNRILCFPPSEPLTGPISFSFS